jgi:glycosyltransferase involved in cell wall biosynthesis
MVRSSFVVHMNILQIFNRYQQLGGEEIMVKHIGDCLRKQHKLDQFIGSTAEMLGNSFHQRLLAPLKAIHNRTAARSLRRRHQEERYNLWLVHNVFPGLSPSVYQVAQELDVPIVQYLHNFRMSCANGFFLNHGEICTRCISGNFTPAFLTACWRDSRIASGTMAIVLTRIRLMNVFGQISKWIATSNAQKSLHEKMGIDGRRITVVPHFIAKPKAPPPYEKDGYLLFVGRLSREKGVQTLLQAWERVGEPARRLVIAGVGPEESALRAYCVANSLKNVQFAGFIPEWQQRSLWAGALALIVPSVWFETFGSVVLQAWSHARPTLVSDIGALPELIEDGSTGRVFAPGDPVHLAEVLGEVMSNPGYAEEMGNRGYKRVIEEFSQEVWLNRINCVLAKFGTLAPDDR